jgi:hypothetical protein
MAHTGSAPRRSGTCNNSAAMLKNTFYAVARAEVG